MHQQDEGFGFPEQDYVFHLISYLFLNLLKVEISENPKFLRTEVASVVALSGFFDDCPIKTPP
jgi:hypothetical protein